MLSGVLPVRDSTFSAWTEHPEDLAVHLSSRVAQAIFEAAKQEGMKGVQIGHGEWDGIMAMEVELIGAPKSFEQTLAKSFEAVLG